MKLLWSWCELCETACIICPKCGNNSCNGGYGEVDGIKCDVCSIAYQYERLAYETGAIPSTKNDIKWMNQKI